jgi:hypothetical protein
MLQDIFSPSFIINKPTSCTILLKIVTLLKLNPKPTPTSRVHSPNMAISESKPIDGEYCCTEFSKNSLRNHHFLVQNILKFHSWP